LFLKGRKAHKWRTVKVVDSLRGHLSKDSGGVVVLVLLSPLMLINNSVLYVLKGAFLVFSTVKIVKSINGISARIYGPIMIETLN